jgi:hypothetical protein
LSATIVARSRFVAAIRRTRTRIVCVLPQPLERLLLQDPQEFGLEIQWNVADLVEKERATVRELESADAAGQHNGKP